MWQRSAVACVTIVLMWPPFQNSRKFNLIQGYSATSFPSIDKQINDVRIETKSHKKCESTTTTTRDVDDLWLNNCYCHWFLFQHTCRTEQLKVNAKTRRSICWPARCLRAPMAPVRARVDIRIRNQPWTSFTIPHWNVGWVSIFPFCAVHCSRFAICPATKRRSEGYFPKREKDLGVFFSLIRIFIMFTCACVWLRPSRISFKSGGRLTNNNTENKGFNWFDHGCGASRFQSRWVKTKNSFQHFFALLKMYLAFVDIAKSSQTICWDILECFTTNQNETGVSN